MDDKTFDSFNAGPSPHPQPWAQCPSTHCERACECRSPHDCIVRSKQDDTRQDPSRQTGDDWLEYIRGGAGCWA